jgi:predicted transcriptional regulator
MSAALTALQRKVAYQLFMRGESVDSIALEFGVSVCDIEAVLRSRGTR